MLFVVVMGTVWSLIIATDNGVRTIPPIYSRAARTMGSTGLHTWTHVVIPAALPFLLSGMKQGWAFAWRSLMAAEIYVTILERLRTWPTPALWPGTPCHGPSHRRHPYHHFHRSRGRQITLRPNRTLHAPAMGDSPAVTVASQARFISS